MIESRIEPAFLFIRVDVEHLAFDPFILDYKRQALMFYCKKHGYEPYENLIHGGVGDANHFQRITFPHLRNIIQKHKSPPKFLITCNLDELGFNAMGMAEDLRLTTKTVFENEDRNNLWLSRRSG